MAEHILVNIPWESKSIRAQRRKRDLGCPEAMSKTSKLFRKVKVKTPVDILRMSAMSLSCLEKSTSTVTLLKRV